MSATLSPLENKNGLNMFWKNTWDDSINYTKKLQQDIFINMFFVLIFKKITFFNSTYFLKFKPSNILYTRYNKIHYSLKLFNSYLFNSKQKVFIYYFGKIFICRYSKWIIIMTHIYIPQVKVSNGASFDFFTETSENYLLTPLNKFFLNKKYFKTLNKISKKIELI